MKSLFGFWAVVLIFSLAATGLAIRYLAVRSIPLSESLIVRGLVCLLVVVLWARHRSLSLQPKSLKTQLIRAAVAGLALTFFSMSYTWLSASTIAMLSNVDVPLLVILGSIIGQPSSTKAKFLSLLSIVVLVMYGVRVQQEPNWLYGLCTLGLGMVLLCFGYYFIKKSMTEENRAITILTPALAIVFYGVVQKFLIEAKPDILSATSDISSATSDILSATPNIRILAQLWDTTSLLVCFGSGLGMFGAYYATMKLYALTDIATAEFPTLLSSLAVQPLEFLLFDEPWMATQFALSVLFVGCTYLILNCEKFEIQTTHAS